MSSNNIKDIQDSIQFNIPFHKNCQDFIQYTKNIRQIELETHTKIKLLQIVRISGDIKNIKEANQRVSRLNDNFAQNKNQNNLKNEVHILKSKMQEMENNYNKKINELTDALTNNKLELEAIINTKIQENVVNEDFSKGIFQSELEEMKNSFDQKILELSNALTNNKLQMEAIIAKDQENDKNVENQDIISDKELENFYKSMESVNYLYKFEEYVNGPIHSGAHPSHSASKLGRLDVVKKLIKNGLDVNIKDNNNWTPLIYATLYGHKEIVEYLIYKNADVNIKGTNNNTALSLARKYNYKEITKILENHGATI